MRQIFLAILAGTLCAPAVAAFADTSNIKATTTEDRDWCYMAGLAIEHAGVERSNAATGQSGLKIMLVGEKLASVFNSQQEVTDDELEPLLEMPLAQLVAKAREVCISDLPDLPAN